MKAHLDIAHAGNLGDDDRTTMTFDENSIAHLMSVLTDLYSNKELAVVREYATNALDSHRAAGNPAPIEVKLPTTLDPLFVVTDHGTGMSLDTIRDVYSKYGASTKRDSDLEVGMLGLGCKAALTYTPSFTFVSVYNGLRVTVLVTREASGAGAVQIVDTVATDAPNGVEVRIPVKHPGSFNVTARTFFWFWEPGSVIVDGELIETTGDHYTTATDLLALDPDVILTKGNTVDHVVMGGVPYPCDQLITMGKTGHYRAIIFVPIGAVNFTPSREALQRTKRTEEVVAEARHFVQQHLLRRAQADVDSATTFSEALTKAQKWREITRYKPLTYRGHEVPTDFGRGAKRMLWWKANNWVTERAYGSSHISKVNIEDALKATHVVGLKGNGLPVGMKCKINKWLTDNGVTDKQVILSTEFIGGVWLDGVRVVEWDTIKQIELPGEKAAPKTTAKYRVLDAYGQPQPAGTLRRKQARKVFWVGAGEPRGTGRNSMFHEVANLVGKGVLVAVVSKQQEDKFRRDHPHVRHVRTWFAEKLTSKADQITPHGRFLMTNAWEWRSSGLPAVDPQACLDPELADLLQKMAGCGGRSDRQWDRLVSLARTFGVPVPELPKPTNLIIPIDRFSKKYPLLGQINYPYEVDPNATEYVNALYTFRNNQPDNQQRSNTK